MKNQNMRLTILIGIPGSGKSSYARRLGEPTVSLDGIRRRLYGDASILGKTSEVDRQMRRKLEAYARRGRDVVLDATHISSRRRRRMIRLGRGLGYQTIAGIWFNTPLAECLRRNRKRKRRVPEFVIRKMDRDLRRQPPSLEEGFDTLKQVDASLNL